MAQKIKVSKANVTYARGERTAKLRAYIKNLGADDAVPLNDVLEEFDLKHRHAWRVCQEEAALATLSVDGKPIVCVLNPKTAKRLENAKKTT